MKVPDIDNIVNDTTYIKDACKRNILNNALAQQLGQETLTLNAAVKDLSLQASTWCMIKHLAGDVTFPVNLRTNRWQEREPASEA